MSQDETKYVDNVILQKDLFKLYKDLISSRSWHLCRSTTPEDIEYGCFAGFIVKDGDQVHDAYWYGYFLSLFERINMRVYEKYNYRLSNNIQRIHLGAKNEMSRTDFHLDTDIAGHTSVVGFLTPVWSQKWSGAFQIEDETIEYTPGKFMIFNSDKLHDGTGPVTKIPYWKISINYVVKNYEHG